MRANVVFANEMLGRAGVCVKEEQWLFRGFTENKMLLMHQHSGVQVKNILIYRDSHRQKELQVGVFSLSIGH